MLKNLVIVGIFLFLGLLASLSYIFLGYKEDLAKQNEPKKMVKLRGSEGEVAGIQLRKIGDIDLTSVTAESILIYHYPENEIVFERNSMVKRKVASLTKLITTLVAIDVFPSGHYIKASVGATGTLPEIGIKTGDEYLASDLLLSMMVGSANDATQAVARDVERLTGKKISDLMNEKALELSMRDSRFDNPNGYDSQDNYSTAQDMAKAVHVLLTRGYNMIYGRQKEVSSLATGGDLVQMSTNLTTIDDQTYLIKTGHTDQAKDNLIALTEDGHHKFIYIILGSKDREKDFALLKYQIQKNYISQ